MRKWLLAALAGAALFLAAGIPLPNTPVVVANTTALKALPTTAAYGGVVTRLTDGVAGSPALNYLFTGGACSLGSGAGDGGSQIPAANGNCWTAQFPPGPKDVRFWGAPVDGATDAGPAINACEVAVHDCLIPVTGTGMSVQTNVVVPGGSWLLGVISNGENFYPGYTFSGASQLNCAHALTGNCVTWGTGGSLTSGGVEHLLILGGAGTPSSGTKGLVIAGGYNVNITDVTVSNFDTCFELDQVLNGVGYGNNAGTCATHFWTFNTTAGFTEYGGRAGNNGSGNLGTHTDMVYFTSTLGSGGGGSGPNSIQFDGYFFDNDTGTCKIRWGNYTEIPGSAEQYHFVGDYFEPFGTGENLFCSDSTVTTIHSVHFDDNYVSQDSGAEETFGLNANTCVDGWEFTGNTIALATLTLAPTGCTTTPAYGVKFIGNSLPPTVTFTPGGALRSAVLSLVGNTENTLVLDEGTYGWFSLSVQDNVVNYTNNTDLYGQQISIPAYGISMGDRTVATLPACSSTMKGSRFTVGNATAQTAYSTVIGGGSHLVNVTCDGTNWVEM